MYADHLVAHRGYPARLPENTLASIEAALQTGARYVEVDVQLSRDGEVVLFHDRDMLRLCGQPGPVHDYGWEELQAFRVQMSLPIPRLAEVIDLLQSYPDVVIFVELKRISLETFGVDVMVQKVLPLLRPIATQVALISYNLEALQRVRQRSSYPIGVVIDEWEEREQSVIRQLRPEYLFCDLGNLPVEGNLECNDCTLVLFECTDPQQALGLLQRGASLIETFAFGEMQHAMAKLGGT